MTGGAAASYSFGLGYAPDGDVTAATDSAHGNWSYGYDALNRLISAAGNGVTIGYGYDRFGNMWQHTISPAPHPAPPALSFDANNRIAAGVAYDAAGELTSDGTHTYQYDGAGRLTGVDGGATARYVYNAEGRRVERAVGGQKFEEIYDLGGRMVAEAAASSGAWQRGEVFGAGRHIASYADGTTYFPHADWLGTERVRAAAGDDPYEACASLWFGDGLSCRFAASSLDPSPLHFTGKERDSESGNDYFGARYYGSTMGRFLSPDPLNGKLIDPQTLNKYSYVRDNPVTLTDPTGLYTCADDQNKCQTKQDKAFYKALQNDLKSKDSNVVRAAQAYGDPTKDNGVTLKFGDPGNGRGGVTRSDLRVDPNNPNKFQAVETVAIRPGLSGSALDAVVGHEGSHVADAQDFAASVSMQGGFDASKNLSTYQTEFRAYMVTQSILSMDNTKLGFGDCGMSGPCMLGAGIMPAQAAQTINELLANPANRYGTAPNYGVTPANPGPALYPNLTTPH